MALVLDWAAIRTCLDTAAAALRHGHAVLSGRGPERASCSSPTATASRPRSSAPCCSERSRSSSSITACGTCSKRASRRGRGG
jgi:hypothetical protein